MHKHQDHQPNDDHLTRLPQSEHGSLVGARAGHERLHPILSLQRQIGNRATQRYLQRRPADTSHQRIAASILVAMNVNPTTYGFVAYSTTRSLGESFLQELDPNVPTVDARLRESKAIASEIAAFGGGEIDTEDFFSRK